MIRIERRLFEEISIEAGKNNGQEPIPWLEE